MKNIILLIIVTLTINAKIDFKKHIEEGVENIALEITNVSRRELLHLRLEPSYRSSIIYNIPYDAKNLITYDKDILQKLGKDVWVAVRVKFIDGFYDGWLKAKYLKLYESYSATVSKDLVLFYPSFLKVNIDSGGWVRLYNSIGFEHYSGCDDMDSSELLDEYFRFDIRVKSYYSLLDIFRDDDSFDLATYERVSEGGWFRRERDDFFKRVNLFGLRGYKILLGVESCGVNVYFFKINGKILVIKEPFDRVPPTPKEGKKIPKNLNFSDKNEIMRYIIENLRLL